MPADAAVTSADAIASLTAHTWTPQPEPARFVQQILGECLSRCSFAAELSRRMLVETGTRLVDWAKEGDKLWVIPPTGRFLPVYEDDRHLVCIAGGSGVTPFRGFVREATRRHLKTRITVLYSVRTITDIIFNEEFRQLAQENPNFSFYVTCTRLQPDDSWPGRRGRISAEWIREQIVDLSKTVFYACGPNELVDATEKLVRDDLKVPKEQMKTEKWG